LVYTKELHKKEMTKASLQIAILRYRSAKQRIRVSWGPLGLKLCNVPNWHVGEHMVQSIFLYGVPIEFSGQRGENKLRYLKRWAGTMNWHNQTEY